MPSGYAADAAPGEVAAYQVLVRLCTRTDSADTTFAWTAFAGLAATTLVGPWQWQWPTSIGWALLIAIALLNALASYSLIRAFAVAEAGAVQPYSYTALVRVTILGLVVFGDFPDEWTIAGAAIIVASSLYTWHHDRRLPPLGLRACSETSASFHEMSASGKVVIPSVARDL